MSTQPNKAAAGRFNGKIFNRRPLIRRYVKQKMAMAQSSFW
jgi:hypothetical protein